MTEISPNHDRIGGQASEPASGGHSSMVSHVGAVFRTTRWSVVRQAREGRGVASMEGMERLARIYWRPLHAFALRQGLKESDAQDATQGFLGRFATGNYLEKVDESKGRFRSFLLVCFKNYLADERQKAAALKRGGGKEFVPFEASGAEETPVVRSGELNGEEQYDLEWANALMSEMLRRLEAEHQGAAKAERYQALRPYLVEDPSAVEQERLKKKLSLGESGLRSALQRLRFRFGEYLWTEIAKTVSNVSEVEQETRYLLGILSKTDWLAAASK